MKAPSGRSGSDVLVAWNTAAAGAVMPAAQSASTPELPRTVQHDGYRIEVFETAGWHALVFRPGASAPLLEISHASAAEGIEACLRRAVAVIETDKGRDREAPAPG